LVDEFAAGSRSAVWDQRLPWQSPQGQAQPRVRPPWTSDVPDPGTWSDVGPSDVEMSWAGPSRVGEGPPAVGRFRGLDVLADALTHEIAVVDDRLTDHRYSENGARGEPAARPMRRHRWAVVVAGRGWSGRSTAQAKVALGVGTVIAVIAALVVSRAVAPPARPIALSAPGVSAPSDGQWPAAVAPPSITDSSPVLPPTSGLPATSAEPTDPPQHGPGPAPGPSLPPSATSPAAPTTSTSSGTFFVTGQLSCVSGKAIVGVWVQASQGSGFSSWKSIGDGSTADYWYTLSTTESYSLHVGCGGTPQTWEVAAYSPVVSGSHNSFDCIDVASNPNYAKCIRR
jgi:hypothetical protein